MTQSSLISLVIKQDEELGQAYGGGRMIKRGVLAL